MRRKSGRRVDYLTARVTEEVTDAGYTVFRAEGSKEKEVEEDEVKDVDDEYIRDEEEVEEKQDAEEEKGTPMAKARSIIKTAKRESMMQRRKTTKMLNAKKKKELADIAAGSREPSPVVKPRRVAPFHMQHNALENVNWFTKLCGDMAAKSVIKGVAGLKDTQREVVLERAKKRDQEKREGVARVRKRR